MTMFDHALEFLGWMILILSPFLIPAVAVLSS